MLRNYAWNVVCSFILFKHKFGLCEWSVCEGCSVCVCVGGGGGVAFNWNLKSTIRHRIGTRRSPFSMFELMDSSAKVLLHTYMQG